MDFTSRSWADLERLAFNIVPENCFQVDARHGDTKISFYRTLVSVLISYPPVYDINCAGPMSGFCKYKSHGFEHCLVSTKNNLRPNIIWLRGRESDCVNAKSISIKFESDFVKFHIPSEFIYHIHGSVKRVMDQMIANSVRMISVSDVVELQSSPENSASAGGSSAQNVSVSNMIFVNSITINNNNGSLNINETRVNVPNILENTATTTPISRDVTQIHNDCSSVSSTESAPPNDVEIREEVNQMPEPPEQSSCNESESDKAESCAQSHADANPGPSSSLLKPNLNTSERDKKHYTKNWLDAETKGGMLKSNANSSETISSEDDSASECDTGSIHPPPTPGKHNGDSDGVQNNGTKKREEDFFQCDICGRIFANNFGLKRHRADIHQVPYPYMKVDKPFKCGCGKRFAQAPSLSRHKQACTLKPGSSRSKSRK